MITALARIQLLGGLTFRQGAYSVSRFQTRHTASLLAFLAYYPARRHMREALVDLLWPGVEPQAGRNRLRQALSSLRRQLSPPGAAPGGLLITDREHVGLSPDACVTDVREFEAILRLARQAKERNVRAERFQAALDLYAGELLPGHYEEWILPERARLEQEYRAALLAQTTLREESGELERALALLLRASALDPWDEEAQERALRLYIATGQTRAARQHYHAWESRLRTEMGSRPSASMRRLIALTEHNAHTPTLTVSDSVALPSRTPARSTPSLPVSLTRFFGREAELEQLTHWLCPVFSQPTCDTTALPEASAGALPTRLVTITGAGGMGKTRLALEAAVRLRAAYRNALYWISLDDVVSEDGVLRTVLRTLNPGAAPEDLWGLLCDMLSGADALLVLDNFKPDACGGSGLAARLLHNCPALRLLVTARQSLELEGEQELRIAPLPTPSEDAPANQQLDTPGMQLYLDRARAARPDFQITPRSAGTIAALCRGLEGIPLAIELAAAQAQALTPAQMLERLQDRFRLLVSRRRTLFAVLQESYHQLTPEERRVFGAVSIFRGGWTLDAALVICGAADSDPKEATEPDASGSAAPRCEEVLRTLQARSLVFTEECGDRMRYGMLETLREFAENVTDAAERALNSQRHAAFFTRLACDESGRLETAGAEKALAHLDREQENLRAALLTLLPPAPAASLPENGKAGLLLAAALGRYWAVRGEFTEGRMLLSRALERAPQGTEAAQAEARRAAGNLAFHQGDYAAARLAYEETLAYCRDQEDPACVATLLNNLARIAHAQGRYLEAERLYTESLALSSQLGLRPHVARALNNLGQLAYDRDDLQEARRLFEQSLESKRELGDQAGIANTLNNLGLIYRDLNQTAAANLLLREALACYRHLRNPVLEATSQNNLDSVALHEGNQVDAERWLQESLQIRRRLGDRAGLAFSLEGFAELASSRDEFFRAAQLYAAAETLRGQLAMPRSQAAQREADRGQAAARAALGEESYRAACQLGSMRSLEQTLLFVLGTETPAQVS